MEQGKQFVKYFAICALILVAIAGIAYAQVYVVGITDSITTNIVYEWGDVIINGSDWTDRITVPVNYTIINSTNSTIDAGTTTSVGRGAHYANFTTTIADKYWIIIEHPEGTVIGGGFFTAVAPGGSATCAIWSDSVCPSRDITGTLN